MPVSLAQTCRNDAGKLLYGEHLGGIFHRLLYASSSGSEVHDKTKLKQKIHRKNKTKSKDKVKAKREKSPEKMERIVPEIQLHGNPSLFSVYSSIRQVVLEDQMKQVSQIYLQASQMTRGMESDSDGEGIDKGHETPIKLPKIVSIGLCSVIELIRETHSKYPELCSRALQALLDMLQGQQPESLKTEPVEVIDSLYHLLMDLSQSRVSVSSHKSESESLTALACSCLLSLVVARGDTGKLLTAVAAMLMFSSKLATQEIKLPFILTSLQKSLMALLIGKAQLPEWLSHGIRTKSRLLLLTLTELQSQWPLTTESNTYTSLASDGRYLYLHSCYGLVKIGSGYGNTILGHIYATNTSFRVKEHGWLAVVKGKLLYKAPSDSRGILTVINTETLQPIDKINLDTRSYGPNVMFSDSEHLGHIASFRDDSFVVRTFDPFHPNSPVSELTLKLARKCLEVFGSASFDTQEDLHCINFGSEEDALSLMAGKDFAFMRTTNNKIYYMGKSQCLGIRPSSSSSAPSGAGNLPASASASSGVVKWAELPIIKSPKIVQYSVGHEGSHGLLVAEDGSVFFVGTARRGEDGDTGSLSKARRQVKAVKPKKMIRLEGKVVTYSACNSGTSALVTRDGDVYMFGKDTVHCDHSTGLLLDVKGLGVMSIALGKAHGVLLTSKGQVYTFGLNNKGQCGREFVSSGAPKELSVAVTMADDEEEIDDESICAPGKHRWDNDQCLICTVCGECTGYGNTCINSGRPDRNPGQPCGCGTGDSGCAECGSCRHCAGERNQHAAGNGGGGEGGEIAGGNDALYNGRLMDALCQAQDPMPFDLFLGRHRARLEGRRGQGQGGARFKRPSASVKLKVSAAVAEIPVGGASGGGGGSDYEQDPLKLTSLAPGQLEIGSGDNTVLQVACGLHHTVLLLDNGDVYAFGSNQYGQLGLGDTIIRGTPTRVLMKSSAVKQVAAGSNHTVLLTSNGQVFTFGCHKKGQLGRPIDDDEKGIKDQKNISPLLPGALPGIGAKQGRRATWIGASADQTFLRVDESLINVHTLGQSNVIANTSSIVLIPMVDVGHSSVKCLVINRLDGGCRSFINSDQVNLAERSVCLDPVNDVIWSFNHSTKEIDCYNVMIGEMKRSVESMLSLSNVLSHELAIPVQPGHLCSRSHCAINLLGCLDSLTLSRQLNLVIAEESGDKQTTSTSYLKDDFSVVNRFESHGGGWGYSGHSIEAIRFMCDSDILLGGFGLFGGRGEYFGKIKLFELGADAGDNETEGELLAETEEVPYRCGAREKYALLFDEPVSIQANCWYVAWARISGPSSDCGSSGQALVTTEDQVVFRFRNSKKSNNGTDANAGQIPQLLYRLPSPDMTYGGPGSAARKGDQTEQIHILSQEFSHTVSPECFESLISLLSWSWGTFCSLGSDVQQMKGINYKAALLDLRQLVYISSVSLRLIRTYICEIYPWQAIKAKAQVETPRLAECVGEVRLLLRQILSESSRYHQSGRGLGGGGESFEGGGGTGNETGSGGWTLFEELRERILEECHNTFTSCFHAFYPTGNLKWICLCELLTSLDLSRDVASNSGRLLSAVMEALCHPAIKLTAIMPINGDHSNEQQQQKARQQQQKARQQQQTVTDDNTGQCSSLLGDALSFPMLVGHMIHRTEMELIGRGHWTFKDAVDKLLFITGLPLRQTINQEKIMMSLAYNACCLLVALVSELSAAATGTEVTVTLSSRPLLKTPSRFTRTSQGTYWNTGNGSPDAVCFTVNTPGIVIAGVGLYGGGGTYEYDLELLDDSERSNDPSPNGRWNSLEIVKGTYGADDCINDIAEIKFSKAVPIKENVNYAIRLRNRGNRTKNGDGGLGKVKCSDGTVFSFGACSLSSNGTNHSRGQIPQILYYSSPQEGDVTTDCSRSVVESQSRRNAITIVSTIFHSATDLLQKVKNTKDDKIFAMINSSPMFSTLLPMVTAYVRSVAMTDPWGAVQILSLIQEILPSVASLNRIHPAVSVSAASAASASAGDVAMDDEHDGVAKGETGLFIPTSFPSSSHRHYAIVESDHPYKPATVSNYRVTFPDVVQWMVLEFDAQSGTAQVEDYLQLYIPAKANLLRLGASEAHGASSVVDNLDTDPVANEAGPPSNWWPVLRKFHGTENWTSMAIVLPGNDIYFSLETASYYLKDEKAYNYGFKCTVVGYEWSLSTKEGLLHLEQELSGLGGICAASLMRKDVVPVTVLQESSSDEDLSILEASAQQVFSAHPSLLSRGFSLFHMPTVNQALEGHLPLNNSSNERTFLQDFINCNPGTSGGRLASWLQPEPFLDPKKCTISYNKDELRCNWPVSITIQTKDQYGHLVKVPNLKVEAKAVPIIKDCSEERRVKRLSRYDTEGSLIFGGLPPPRLDIPYQVTTKDNKDSYHAISMMKAFENYSFEELRYSAPTVRRPTENMLIRDNEDGTYCASWTPGGIGYYNLYIQLDGFETGEVFKVEVNDPPHGVTPPNQPQNARRTTTHANRMRKFVAAQSAGLRVRLHPSLQSEQIGIIRPGGIITFTSEIHNNDGVWLRLSSESIRACCSPLNGYTEGWALQYNQHLGKTLLIPVEEPRPSADRPFAGSPSRRPPDPRGSRIAAAAGRTFPCIYTTVKCGLSGHNIRVVPDLDSPAIGMVILGNQLTAVSETTTNEGTWVKLNKSSVQCYCHEADGDAWCLIATNSGDIYLTSDSDTDASAAADAPFGAAGRTEGIGSKGFDFTTAAKVPLFSTFANIQPEFSGGGCQAFGGGIEENRSPTHTPFSSCDVTGSEDSSPSHARFSVATHTVSSTAWPGGDPGSQDRSSVTLRYLETEQDHSSVPDPLGKTRSASLRREELPLQFPSANPYPSSNAKSASSAGGGGCKETASTVRRDLQQQQRIHLQFPDLPPELQGVSVKDLVKALGESRVNGNGVTPPRTPPGTPKKTLSRSSSPKAPVSPFHDSSTSLNFGPNLVARKDNVVMSASPLSSTSICCRISSVAGVKTPTSPAPQQMIATAIMTSASSVRKVISPPTSKRMPPLAPSTALPANPDVKAIAKSCQRSISSSPQRNGIFSVSDTSGRSSSASPQRAVNLSDESLRGPEITQRHFLTGPLPSKEELRVAFLPKVSRKDRSRTLRTKRERASSPSMKEKSSSSSVHLHSKNGGAAISKTKLPEVALEAMSPSVSHCIRAVFAAFLWHEGIVHDAMACASYLKFHPNLSKDIHRKRADRSSSSKMASCSDASLAKDAAAAAGGVKMEEDSTKMFKTKKMHVSEKEVQNINEAARKGIVKAQPLPKNLSMSKTPEAIFQLEVKTPAVEVKMAASSKSDLSTLLPTIRHLVSFWEEFSSATSRVVEQNLILPSRLVTIQPIAEADRDEKEKNNVKAKSKKSKENKHNAIQGARGNLFGDAAGGAMFPGAGADKDTICELCGHVFPHPVTYHMRQAHPGCGKPAGGQGYNSGGNFCGGWAGNCGDGGVGGSTWYLMCDVCRSKYLRDRNLIPKKSKKKNVIVKQSSYLPTLEPHLIMKNNALFILDLATAATNLPSQSHQQLPTTQYNGAVDAAAVAAGNLLPMLTEDTTVSSDQSSFPRVPFAYLEQCGAKAADSAFNEDAIFTEEMRRHRTKGGRNFEHSISQGQEVKREGRVRPNSIYVAENTSPVGDGAASLEETEVLRNWMRLSDDEDKRFGSTQKAFQRSVSEMGSGVLSSISLLLQRPISDFDGDGEIKESEAPGGGEEGGGGGGGGGQSNGRRRNNSTCLGDGGMSLLKHPSATMSKLIQASEKSRNDRKSLSVDYVLKQPVMTFCTQRHNLDSLQRCMKAALCKASCRVFAMQAFNWLVRQVTQLECLHDLFWLFVSALSSFPPSSFSEDDVEEPVADGAAAKVKDKKDQQQRDAPEKSVALCEHPLSDLTIAGNAVAPLIHSYHSFLQTVSDVMMYLPAGSAVQQMAVRCWCLKFQLSDHVFLHRSHVFSNISKILSKSDEGWELCSGGGGGGSGILQSVTRATVLSDLTSSVDIKASSRQAMIASVTDGSTETFWESGDEDKNKAKTMTVTCVVSEQRPRVVYAHVDNTRDLGNKVTSIGISAGPSAEELTTVRQLDVELRYAGWICVWLPDSGASRVIRLELKGPDNSLRVRQLKVLGESKLAAGGGGGAGEEKPMSVLAVQQKNCETETLKVFRLLTSQVFGRLINEVESSSDDREKSSEGQGEAEGDLNLKEHMVSILFSRSKLTQLQKQVCAHIVQAIRKETIRVQEQWEDRLTGELASGVGRVDGAAFQSNSTSDAYCFELLSLVLALSGSNVGRQYLAQQHSLLEDLLSLLHTASPRVQRQAVALIRRVLLDVPPRVLAGVLGVPSLPPSDFSILSSTGNSSSSSSDVDVNQRGVLDVFLACIAKALTVQVKSKSVGGGKGKTSAETFHLADCFAPNSVLPGRWWFRGGASVQLAETIIGLLKDLSSGKLTKEWASVTKSAIAEPVLSLLHITESQRNPADCIKTPTLWLMMAALCVLSDEHVDQLSSGQWAGGGKNGGDNNALARPMCENHDDGETMAMILCSDCGNLCADCDRILHLHRKTRGHQRQVFKEEEEAIKVDIHEGCGRIKLYWLLALADSKTLKAVVEFRNTSKEKLCGGGQENLSGVSNLEPCRFCCAMTHPGLLTAGTVCNHPECEEHARNACTKTLTCGHICGGIRAEDPCLFCLHGCSATQNSLKQDADDMCMICFTEALSAAPAIQLACGHVFHLHCCRQVLQRRWPGPRITFGFSRCPICKADIVHPILEEFLLQIRNRYEDVRRKALMRLEYEGLHKADAITTAGMSFHNDPAGYAMARYAYYVCFKCDKAYYGGEARCEEQAAPDEYDPSELVCGACSDVSRAQMCSRHGADFLEYKCRYCCSVAIFFCFGTTHFCNACHEDFQRVTTIAKSDLPQCPAGPKAKQLEGEECPLHVVHPPTGEEFALGCGVCRNAHTF